MKKDVLSKFMNNILLVLGPINCPSGYQKQDGDIIGGGIKGGFSSTLDGCKNECNADKRCKSFTYSSSKEDCVLYAQSEANGPIYQDYIFCVAGMS